MNHDVHTILVARGRGGGERRTTTGASLSHVQSSSSPFLSFRGRHRYTDTNTDSWFVMVLVVPLFGLCRADGLIGLNYCLYVKGKHLT